MKRILLVLVFFNLLTLPLLAQTKTERKEQKEEQRQAYFEQSRNLIESGSFSFVAEWIIPQNLVRRRVLNRLAYLRVSDGNAEAYFPYFGIVRAGGAHDGGGIEFNNEIRNYRESYDEDEKNINIGFTVSSKTETYQVELNVIKGSYVKVFVHSNKRDSMEYDGALYEFEE